MSWHNIVRTYGSWDMTQARTYIQSTYGMHGLGVHTVPNYGSGGPRWDLERDNGYFSSGFAVSPSGFIPGPTFHPASQVTNNYACAHFNACPSGQIIIYAGPQQMYPVMSPNNSADFFSVAQPFGVAIAGYLPQLDALWAGGLTWGGPLGCGSLGNWSAITDILQVTMKQTNIAMDTNSPSICVINVNAGSTVCNVFSHTGSRIVRSTYNNLPLVNPGPLLDIFLGLYFPTVVSCMKLHTRAFTEPEIRRFGQWGKRFLRPTNIDITF